jgi:uncharacterized membrane protein YdbT with pleckstrin-like domain
MGRYIDDILQPGEKVLYSTNVHWIFYWKALLAWLAALTCVVIARVTDISSSAVFMWLVFAGVSALAALYWSLTAWFHHWTTETDVTNLRVVHKSGFIQRRTFEMSLDKVESVDVNQSVAGRIFNYGDVTINGVGEGRETIRTVAAPIAFRNYITARHG